jgi:hypothetical protein
MELSPSSEAANCAATQELPSILWNPKVHHRVQKSQINSVHTTASSLSKVHLNAFCPARLGLPSAFFLSGFAINILHAFISARIPVTGSAHIILLDLIILIILAEEYKLWSSSLCNFLQPHVTSFFLEPNVLLSTLFSNTLFGLSSSLNVRDKVSRQ